MSVDREEIKWKFQLLLETMRVARSSHENEQRDLHEMATQDLTELKEARNSILAGIGFAIGILVSLISIGVLSNDHVWFIILGIIAGVGIFVGFNMLTYRRAGTHGIVNAKFRAVTLDFLGIEGKIAGIAMREDLRKEDVLLLTVFVSVIGQAFSYDLGYFAAEKLKLQKPSQDTFRNAYEMTKNQLELIKQTNLREYIPKLESFVKEFEMNEKSNNT